jgi:hypothetical protein
MVGFSPYNIDAGRRHSISEDLDRRLSADDGERYMAKKLPNVHPGEVLLEEFLEPLQISQNRLAREIGVPPRRINEIVLVRRSLLGTC